MLCFESVGDKTINLPFVLLNEKSCIFLHLFNNFIIFTDYKLFTNKCMLKSTSKTKNSNCISLDYSVE